MASYEKKENGKWSVRFRVFEDGCEINKRISGFRTKREAEKAYSDYLNRKIHQDDGTSNITFEKLCGSYFAFCETRIKQTSLYDEKNKVKKHVLPFFGKTLVVEIKPLQIANWQSKMSKEYSYSHVSNIRILFNSILKFGEKYYDLPNPMKKVDSLRNLSPKKEMSIWTVEQFERFFNIVDDETERTFFTVLFYCGLRRGEALALTWEDYDEKSHRLKITKSVTNRIVGKDWAITTTKNKNSVRTILVPERVHNELLLLKKGKKKKDFMFKGERPLPMETVRRHFHEYQRKTDLPKIRIHDLRHSCASHLLSTENGKSISPVAVAKYLGHTVEVLLSTYAHMLPNAEMEIVEKFNTRTHSVPTEK